MDQGCWAEGVIHPEPRATCAVYAETTTSWSLPSTLRCQKATGQATGHAVYAVRPHPDDQARGVLKMLQPVSHVQLQSASACAVNLWLVGEGYEVAPSAMCTYFQDALSSKAAASLHFGEVVEAETCRCQTGGEGGWGGALLPLNYAFVS